MADTTHVWLLEQGSPAAPGALEPWLKQRLTDPAVLPLPYLWLRVIVAWALIRLRLRRHTEALAALPGPAPEVGALIDLAAALERQLGPRYRCSAVLRHGRPDAAAAAAEVPRGSQVVLLPMPVVDDATRRGLLAHARAALAPRRARLAEGGPLSAADGVLAALARGVRRAILHLPPHTPYRVLFCAFAQGEAAAPAVEDLHARLVRRLRLPGDAPLARVRPFGLGSDPLAGVEPLLDGLAGAPAVVVAPLGSLTHHADVAALQAALTPALAARGVTEVRLALPPADCPGLVHALYARVKAAERGMAWVVPEDAVRDAVRAELRRQGAVWLPREGRP
jgi:hypothetical protein